MPTGIGLLGQPAFDDGIGATHYRPKDKADGDPEKTMIDQAQEKKATEKNRHQGRKAPNVSHPGNDRWYQQRARHKAGKVSRATQADQCL